MNSFSPLKDLFSLFFPALCESCRGVLVTGETLLCTRCDHNLPRTGFHMHRENAMTRIFWGRTGIEGATALYYYHKGGGVQELVHRLKYHGRKDLGRHLGMLLGQELLASPCFKDLQAVIPVPLHEKRLRSRGFNQSEVFAEGIAAVMEIPVNNTTLRRTAATPTQTRKSRFHRWENVKRAFEVNGETLGGARKLLLVDDVLTTGSTLEACATRLLSMGDARIYIATIGFTP
jgi:ComF family protein